MKKNTNKEMKKELENYRKLSVLMVANKMYIDYKTVSAFLGAVEPEGYVEDIIKLNFPKLPAKMKKAIWGCFLASLIMNRKRIQK